MFIQTLDEEQIRMAVINNNEAILENLDRHPLTSINWTRIAVHNTAYDLWREWKIFSPGDLVHKIGVPERLRRLKELKEIVTEWKDTREHPLWLAQKVVKALDFINQELKTLAEGFSDSPEYGEYIQFLAAVDELKILKAVLLADYEGYKYPRGGIEESEAREWAFK